MSHCYADFQLWFGWLVKVRFPHIEEISLYNIIYIYIYIYIYTLYILYILCESEVITWILSIPLDYVPVKVVDGDAEVSEAACVLF